MPLNRHNEELPTLRESIVEQDFFCTVCFSNTINTIIIQCGHSFCRECAEKLDMCAVCRGEITSLHKNVFKFLRPQIKIAFKNKLSVQKYKLLSKVR